jgi:hypothetical protein
MKQYSINNSSNEEKANNFRRRQQQQQQQHRIIIVIINNLGRNHTNKDSSFAFWFLLATKILIFCWGWDT